MSHKAISFLALMWFVCTFMCLVLQGTFFSSSEVTTLNFLTGYSTLQLGDLWGVPRLVIGFFTHGFPKLILWDYSFLQGGGYSLIRFIMIVIFSVGAVWGLISLFVPILQRNL